MYTYTLPHTFKYVHIYILLRLSPCFCHNKCQTTCRIHRPVAHHTAPLEIKCRHLHACALQVYHQPQQQQQHRRISSPEGCAANRCRQSVSSSQTSAGSERNIEGGRTGRARLCLMRTNLWLGPAGRVPLQIFKHSNTSISWEKGRFIVVACWW